LRRLADDGTVEKRELPGGQTDYALANESGVRTIRRCAAADRDN
jgi:hypothetical protein